jgi:hypothetical protein
MRKIRMGMEWLSWRRSEARGECGFRPGEEGGHVHAILDVEHRSLDDYKSMFIMVFPIHGCHASIYLRYQCT